MRRFLLIFLISLSLAEFSSAQQISGTVMETRRKPLGFATIAVYKADDTTLITYRLSSPNGQFKVPGLPLNTVLRLLITYSGFEAYRKEFQLTISKQAVLLDTIIMKRSDKMLEELVITAEIPPVVFRKDTVEFNASSFKTLPNALVEDLLKKLPGVDVDRDGNITVEGKAVNRITVDGKSFFGDDPKMASRNLPANVINKVQVTDDKEEMMRRGDDNPDRVGKVINLTFKKGVKKGWFGKVYGGGGNKDLYTAGGIGNIYRDTLQMSILAYANNINKAPFSFTELLQIGGFQRARTNSASVRNNVWRMGTGSGISLDNVNFGGAQGIGGISISKGAGFNMNHSPNKKRSFFLQYFFNHGKSRERENVTNTDQYKGDTTINTRSVMTGPWLGRRHNMAAGLRLKPDSVTNILMNVSFMHAPGIENRQTDIITTNNFTGVLSRGLIKQDYDNQINTYRHNLSLTRLSKQKKGRRITIGHDMDFRKTVLDHFNSSVNHFVYPVIFDTTIQQLRKERIPNTEINFYGNFSEPVTKDLTLRLNARYNHFKYDNSISTFNYNLATKAYDLFNSFLTNDLMRTNDQFISYTGLEFKRKDFTITPAVRMQTQKITNNISSLPVPLQQQQTNLLPSLNAIYKIWNFSYDRSVELPGYNYMISVPDNTNPYNITIGNPELVQKVSDEISMQFRKNYLKQLVTISGNLFAGFTQNDIVPFITIDSRGVFTNKPVNQNGSRNLGIGFFANKQYKSGSKYNFTLGTRLFYNSSRSRLLYNYSSSWQNNYSKGLRIFINMNLNDKFEWSSNYALNNSDTRYTNKVFPGMDLTWHFFENELILRVPKHFIWETNVIYAINPDQAPGGSTQPLVWNAAFNYLMLKNERGVLKFEVNDILKSYQFINVNINRNGITTTNNNVLSRYFLLSFTYNIQTIGEKKKIGGWRLLLF